jgi:tetratricopeptide (TPR) repeat protein
MNKDKLKIAIGVVVVLFVALAFYFLVYKKPPVTVEEPLSVPTEEVLEDKLSPEDTPQASVKDDKQVLFDAKMKEASGYFTKGNYSAAIVAYNQALVISKSEHAYTGIFSAQSAQKNYQEAEKSILSAIKINPEGSDYWSWYLVLLKEKLGASRSKLDTVYNDAYSKISADKKINIVTYYARILESLGDKTGAIAQWQKAITLNSSMQSVYQAEIDALKVGN